MILTVFILLIITLVMVFISLIKPKNSDLVLVPFECAFVSVVNFHKKFSIQLFLILIIFICFDLELVFLGTLLFKWCSTPTSLFVLFMISTLYMEWWMASLSFKS